MNLIDRIPVSKNFFLDEYFPKDMYIQAEKPEDLIKLIDPKLFESDQKLRDRYGPCIINSWWDNMHDNIPDEDQYMSNYRGFRPINCKIGAKGSDHKFGKASDKTFKNHSPKEVRNGIKKDYKELGITKIEDDVNWVHTSVAKTDKSYLQIFYA